MTHFPVTALVSAEIGTVDLAAHAAFYSEVWGLKAVAQTGGGTFFAGTGSDPYILGLIPAQQTALLALTFRSASMAALRDVLARAAAAGCNVSAEPGALDRPGGGTHAEFVDPRGCRIRLVYGDTPRPADAPDRARPARLSHVNINTRDVDGLAAFYSDVMGFRLTDRSRVMAFLRCNSDHHSVVLAEAPVEGLNHLAFLLPEWEGVMLASGRMVDHGYLIGWGIGRHGPGNNVFSYFVDPQGYVVEHTAEVLQVDDSYRFGGPADWTWPPGRTDQWGIAPPKSDACKAAQVAVGFAPGRGADRAPAPGTERHQQKSREPNAHQKGG